MNLSGQWSWHNPCVKNSVIYGGIFFAIVIPLACLWAFFEVKAHSTALEYNEIKKQIAAAEELQGAISSRQDEDRYMDKELEALMNGTRVLSKEDILLEFSRIATVHGVKVRRFVQELPETAFPNTGIRQQTFEVAVSGSVQDIMGTLSSLQDNYSLTSLELAADSAAGGEPAIVEGLALPDASPGEIEDAVLTEVTAGGAATPGVREAPTVDMAFTIVYTSR